MERLKAAPCLAAAVMLSLVLSGCGGGGSSASFDPSTASGLSVSPGSVGFAAVHNGALPPPQSLQIVISRQDAFYLEVGYPLSVTPPTWLTQNPTVSGVGANRTVTGGVITTNMAPGTYTTTLRIAIQDFNRSVLAYRDVPVSYTITTAPLAASPTTLSFLQVIGSPAPGSQTVTVMGDIANWTTAADQSWIGVTPNSGPGGSAVSVSVDPSGLAPNIYTGTVTFSSGGKTAAVAVSLSVALPDFQTNLTSLAFSGVNGATLPAQSLSIGLNNGAPINWNAASGDTWLVLSRTSGTQSDPLGVSVNAANGPLASGTYNSTITLTGSVGGRALTRTINVSLTLTKPAFLPSSSSLSFSGVNGATLPPQSLGIGVSSGTTTAWNAASSAPWLVLDKTSGTTADALGVSVNPATVPLASGVYNSTVTLTGAINGDTLTKTVAIALSLTKATLTVSPASVTFGGSNGRDLSAVPVQLSLNTGANAFAWTSSASPFVQAAPASGSASAAPAARWAGSVHAADCTERLFAAPVLLKLGPAAPKAGRCLSLQEPSRSQPPGFPAVDIRRICTLQYVQIRLMARICPPIPVTASRSAKPPGWSLSSTTSISRRAGSGRRSSRSSRSSTASGRPRSMPLPPSS